jgi:putative transcriptional regulator
LKIADVARETGLHRNTIFPLHAESAARVEREVLIRIRKLFNCNTGDLLEYLPDAQVDR